MLHINAVIVVVIVVILLMMIVIITIVIPSIMTFMLVGIIFLL